MSEPGTSTPDTGRSKATTELPLPPGRDGLPLLGETLPFLDDPAKFVRERVARHGRVFRTRLFGKPTVALIGAEGNRFVLSEGMSKLRWKDGWPPTFPALLGDVLFLQDGEVHRKKRNLLMPAMHSAAVESYIRTMEERRDAALARWEKLERFAWFDELHRLTFEVASTLFLGVDLGADGDRLNRLINQLVEGLLAMPVPLPWTAFGRAKKVRAELLEYVGRAIEQRRGAPARDALGLLVDHLDDEGQRLSDEELRDQALMLVIAGYATTTSMLTYLFYALAEHPEVLARAREEQRALGIEGPLTLEHLKRMTYLDQVVTEVERRYPPISFGMRGAAEGFTFAGHRVPAGWQVLFSIDATHADPEYFPNPERFDPDRFADGSRERAAFKLVGFGGGPRVCMGMVMARTQVKVIASRLLREYAWELEPGQQMRPQMTPARRPKDGLRVQLRRLPRS